MTFVSRPVIGTTIWIPIGDFVDEENEKDGDEEIECRRMKNKRRWMKKKEKNERGKGKDEEENLDDNVDGVKNEVEEKENEEELG